MCRNHSHLIARFLGEDTSGDAPALIFHLADPVVTIESPNPGGATLRLQTSGLLFVPSWMLDGWSRSHVPGMEGRSMSLCFMRDDAPITMPTDPTPSSSSSTSSPILSPEVEYFPNDQLRQDLSNWNRDR